MNLTHIHAFTEAMQRKDLESMLTHMSDDVVLNTPLSPEPVRGKSAIRGVVGPLLSVVRDFDFQEIMQGPQRASSFFKVTIGADTLDGMDYWQLDAAGLITEMTVLWRPLPAIIAARDVILAAAPH